jgi:hypothetical protein
LEVKGVVEKALECLGMEAGENWLERVNVEGVFIPLHPKQAVDRLSSGDSEQLLGILMITNKSASV